jgi:V/A-type H+-transporting ATPase subunit I
LLGGERKVSVEKMKLLSITGKEENIDGFIAEYLLDSGIQTEDAVKVFEKGWKLTNFKYDSTAKDLLKQCKTLLDKYEIKYNKDLESEDISKSLEDLEKELIEIKYNLDNFENYLKEKNAELDDLKNKNEILVHAKNLDINLKELYNLEYVKFRYGKISKENFGKLENSLRELNALTIKVAEGDDNSYWIMCLTTKEASAKVDSYLNLFKFERFWIPEELFGNPRELYEENEKKIQELNFDIENKQNELDRIVNRDAGDLVGLYADFNLYIKINNVKRFMAFDENGLFYIIGWIPAKELTKVLPKLSKEKDIKYVIKNHDEVASIPPTKLKNNGLVRPFETLVKMYGLPNYTEIDPTTFVAITAFLLFGFMFGDVGQGLVIFLIGLILSKKKVSLGPIFEAGRNCFNDFWSFIW